jgi:uncharacterized protein YbjQ (UPF0145 family)
MPLFDRTDWAEEDRRQMSRDRLEAGELTLDAEGRLYKLKQMAPRFTSSLSVSDLALVASNGIRPIGQVTGSVVFHIGWQPDPLGMSVELDVATSALNDAYRLVMDRITKEAHKLGAHGVINIRIDRKFLSKGNVEANDAGSTDIIVDIRDAVVEISMDGTAIAWEHVKPTESPFLSNLSGTDLAKLLEAGYVPSGLVVGNSAYYQIGGFDTRWALQQGGIGRNAGMYNSELVDYTTALYSARRHAIERAQVQATSLGADGIIGLRIEHNIACHEVEIEQQGTKVRRIDAIVHLHAIGCAIREFHEKQPPILYVVEM